MSNRKNETSAPSHKLRRDVHRAYRKEILNSTLFADLINSNSTYQIHRIMRSLKDFFPTTYKEVIQDLKAQKTENSELDLIEYTKVQPDLFFDEVITNLNRISFEQRQMYNKKADMDFSIHLFDKELDMLQSNSPQLKKQFAHHGFVQEFGIRRMEVKKLRFPVHHRKKIKRARINIAIDGVAGAGKSTIAKFIAQKLNYLYIDTGLMYRTIAYITDLQGISLLKEDEIVKAYRKFNVIYEKNKVFLSDIDVSKNVRTPEITRLTSSIAKMPKVRTLLLKEQRRLAEVKGVIMDGRDIGSKVLPQAELKLYFTADPMIRARRRLSQNKQQGIDPSSAEQIFKEINDRDRADLTRNISPLVQTIDAIVIDTSHLTIERTASKIMQLIENKINEIEAEEAEEAKEKK